MHTAFILSIRGTPQLYYGEEIAMEGKEDPDNRRDFPGGFPGDSRNAFTREGRTAIQQRMFDWTRSWISLRREHSSIRQGNLIDLFYDEDAYVFARQDKSETVVIAINRSLRPKELTLTSRLLNLSKWTAVKPLLGTGKGSQVSNGQSQLTIPPQTASAYLVQ